MTKLNDIYIEGMKMKNLVAILLLVFTMTGAAFAENGILSDPLTIGVGARSLGMGKTYVGVAEDADAIFMNPAGIARIANPKLTSMYTSLMGDVNYVVVGGAYPTGNKSALGLGWVSASTGDIVLTSVNGTVEATNGNWGNSVLFLSYGTYLSELPGLSGLQLQRDVLLGANLKYYSVGGNGSATVTSANGTGYGVDLALLVPATDYINVGVNYQNALGGSIANKSTGLTDDLAKTLKLGTKITLLGREGQSVSQHNVRRLYANIDYDLAMNGNRPNVLHLGTEFWPTSNLALRAGSDGNELTAGLGLRYSGIEFNYAYHPYAGINEDATHFFSIGYLGEDVKRALKIVVESPNDKTVIREDNVQVKGRVEVVEGSENDSPLGPLTVKINGINVPVADDRTFNADLPVSAIGKNYLQIEAQASTGEQAKDDVRMVRLITFADVPESYWAITPIENTGTVGLVEGYPDGTFRPEAALTRAELATLLVRAKGLKLPERNARQVFKDVKSDFWAAKYIEVAQMNGLVEGYPDKSFRPNNRISRVEGIAVLTRFDNLKMAQVMEKPYWDISTRHWGAKYIQAAKDAGMLTFVERNQLEPKVAMIRSQAVDMLSKTNLANTEIKNLFDWDKGFQQQIGPGARPRIRASL